MRTLYFDTATTGRWLYREPITAEGQPHLARLSYLIDEDGVVGQWEALIVDPPPTWKYEPGAIEHHHVTPAAARELGIQLRDVMQVFCAAMESVDRVVAFNLAFHWGVMERTHEDLGGGAHRLLPPDRVRTFCAMRKSANHVNKPRMAPGGGVQWPKLTEAYEHFTGTKMPCNQHPTEAGMVMVRAVHAVWDGILAAQPALI